MSNISKTLIEDLLPPSLKNDAGVLQAAKALDEELAQVTECINECCIIANIDRLSEPVIDLLAWQWHIDFYDYNLSIDVKRKLVKQSLEAHRIKGTPKAVENVVTAAFKSGVVEEWFDYSGRPYYFKVRMIKEGMPDINTLQSLVKSINAVKNVRSWLDEIAFRRDLAFDVFFGFAKSINRKIGIYPPKIKLPAFANNQHIKGAQYIHKGVNINA